MFLNSRFGSFDGSSSEEMKASGSSRQEYNVHIDVQESDLTATPHGNDNSFSRVEDNEEEQQNTEVSYESLVRVVDNNCYVCRVCSKVFGTKSSMDRHLRTHTGQRPFVCDVCRKGFRQAAHLRVHTRLHTGEKPFFCKLCKKGFTRKFSLKEHLFNCHKISPQNLTSS